MCGLAAAIGPNYDSTISKFIGLMQDNRGRDGAGFAYYKHTETGIVLHQTLGAKVVCRPRFFHNFVYDTHNEATSLMELFLGHEDVPTSLDTALLLHSRKASYGAANDISLAQPMEVNDIILIHNGTVHKTYELAKQFKIKRYRNDSHLIGQIIAAGNDKELFEMYTGAITCMWINRYEPNCIYYFIGGETLNNIDTPERPLHFCNINGCTYFSSLAQPLRVARALGTTTGGELNPVYAPRVNTCYKVNWEGIHTPLYKVERKVVTATAAEIAQDYNKSVKLLKDKDVAQVSHSHIRYCKGLYWIGASRAHSNIDLQDADNIHPTKISPDGRLLRYSPAKRCVIDRQGNKYTGEVLEFYFLNGCMFNSKSSLLSFVRKHGEHDVSPVHYRNVVPHPVWSGMNSFNMQVTHFYLPINMPIFKTTPLFSDNAYTFTNSILTDVTPLAPKTARRIWKSKLKYYEYDAEFIPK